MRLAGEFDDELFDEVRRTQRMLGDVTAAQRIAGDMEASQKVFDGMTAAQKVYDEVSAFRQITAKVDAARHAQEAVAGTAFLDEIARNQLLQDAVTGSASQELARLFDRDRQAATLLEQSQRYAPITADWQRRLMDEVTSLKQTFESYDRVAEANRALAASLRPDPFLETYESLGRMAGIAAAGFRYQPVLTAQDYVSAATLAMNFTVAEDVARYRQEYAEAYLSDHAAEDAFPTRAVRAFIRVAPKGGHLGLEFIKTFLIHIVLIQLTGSMSDRNLERHIDRVARQTRDVIDSVRAIVARAPTVVSTTSAPTYRVDKATSIRAEPNAGSAEVGTIHRRDSLTIVARDGDWARVFAIQISAKREQPRLSVGWVKADKLHLR